MSIKTKPNQYRKHYIPANIVQKISHGQRKIYAGQKLIMTGFAMSVGRIGILRGVRENTSMNPEVFALQMKLRKGTSRHEKQNIHAVRGRRRHG